MLFYEQVKQNNMKSKKQRIKESQLNKKKDMNYTKEFSDQVKGLRTPQIHMIFSDTRSVKEIPIYLNV